MQAKINAVGIVQGVGFRPFIYRIAIANNLRGHVRNKGDAGVEIVLQGREQNIKQFLHDLVNRKPPLAQIYETLIEYGPEEVRFKKFQISESSEITELAGSTIPPDFAVCNECLKELCDPMNPRYEYFFITCTDCGPRYTTIKALPFDRQNTTLRDFPMCSFCRSEYTDPANRRFHAQTIACPKCGPEAYLTAKDGQLIYQEDPIREAGCLLEEGSILAIKGYGGFHVSTAVTKDHPISRLRRLKYRAKKPFAIMARNLETVSTFAKVCPKENEMLSSHTKPIVLLEKARNYYLSDLIAPGLHNIGVMLPYTGLHKMLFDQVEEPAFVMTSANPPNEPIVSENSEALKVLGSAVDYFLFHNRKIAQKCDDSVVRLHDGNSCFIRRSRGYAPAPISLKRSCRKNVLGVGAEENVTACVLHHNKAFLSQYLGDVENFETFRYMQQVIRHLKMLTNVELDTIACDLHPGFVTTKLAEKIAKEEECSVLHVQHHYAHMLSLMGEIGLEEIVGIVCDGYGYGDDGKAWGGEILCCSKDKFKRFAHLQEQPMIGGDLATRYPLRMVAGILSDIIDLEDWLVANSPSFPHGRVEAQTIISQINGKRSFSTTTSCGRILDAISAILGICRERTYQGEPAMKLESAAIEGHDVLKLEPTVEGDILNTTKVVSAVFESKDKFSLPDLAFSAQSYIAKGLAQLAIELVQKTGVDAIGFSGGVAYNKHITSAIKEQVEENGVKFYIHKAIPAGDGGISFGQAFAAAIAMD